MKSCKRCLVDKPLLEYRLDKRTNKHFATCKSCQREQKRLWRQENASKNKEMNSRHQRDYVQRTVYRFDDEDLRRLDSIEKVCAICGSLVVCIDHDHETNRFRGYLCNTHNLALGGFQDDIERLQAAIDYLKSFKLLGR